MSVIAGNRCSTDWEGNASPGNDFELKQDGVGKSTGRDATGKRNSSTNAACS